MCTILWSQSYINLKPNWTNAVHELTISERERSRRTMPPLPNGSSPVCLWLMMFGSSLTNLTSVRLKYLPYLLEALILIKMICPSITSLDVVKLHYHDFQKEVFWTTMLGLKGLQVLPFMII